MDLFCLRWNEFENNISEFFRRERKGHRFADVTLATDDGQHIQAHKIILSAGSHLFDNMFTKSNHSNMLVYLKGISSDHLEQILDFIYKGEVSIAQEEIEVFIETGKELQIKGLEGELTGMGSTKDEENKHGELWKNDPKVDQTNISTSTMDFDEHYDADITTLDRIKEEKVQFNTNNELDLKIEQMIEKNQSVWNCKVCGKTTKQKQKIQHHVETHIEGMSHSCHICSKTFSNRHNLECHITNNHTGLFRCDMCQKAGMTRAAYNQHNMRHHRMVKQLTKE